MSPTGSGGRNRRREIEARPDSLRFPGSHRNDLSASKMADDSTKSCMKCGTHSNLVPDPHIEDIFFCKECWEEREILERATEMGYDDEFRDEDG